MSGWLFTFMLNHPAVVVWAIAIGCTLAAIVVAVALDFDPDDHDPGLDLYPKIRPGDFPRHVIIHFGPPKPYDWDTSPDTAYLTDPKELA